MHASSPRPSPRSPGCGASPSSATVPPGASVGRKPAARGARPPRGDRPVERPRAPLRARSSPPSSSGAGSLARLCSSTRSLPARSAASGLTVPRGAASTLSRRASPASPRAAEPLSAADPRAALRRGRPPPFAIPVTAQETRPSRSPPSTRPPRTPPASPRSTAHAAWLLDTVRMSEKVQKADFELKYRVWELQSLYDVGLSIARTLDLESLADDMLMTSVSLLNARSGSLLVRRAEGRGGSSPSTSGAAPERGRDLRGAGGGRPREPRESRPACLAGTRPPRSSSRPDRGRRAARSASSSSRTRRTVRAASTTSARRT